MPSRRPKADKVETAAGVEHGAERGQPFMKEPADRDRLAQRQRGAGRNARNGAVDPKEEQFEEPRPFASPFEVTLEAFGEERDQTFDVLDKADGLGEVAFHRKRRHGQARLDDLLDPSQRLVEPQQQHRAEAAGERRAWCGSDRSDRPQPYAFEAGDGGRLEPQGGERKVFEKGLFVALLQERMSGRKARRRPGCARRRGKSGPGV